MSKEFIFNIGLNVGDSEPAEQLHDTLRALVSVGQIQDLAIGKGAWQGMPERFVQARVELARGDAAAVLLARELNQSCVAWRAVGALHGHWWLSWADGRDTTLGDSVSNYPVILGAQSAPAAVKDMPRDTIGHSSIQPWSAGEYFPAVIARIERGGELYGYELTIGAHTELHATRDDAEAVARFVCRNGRIDAARYVELCDDGAATLRGRA